jgi:hypothetical protein
VEKDLLSVEASQFFVAAFPRRKAKFPNRGNRVRISGRKTALARETAGIHKGRQSLMRVFLVRFFVA